MARISIFALLLALLSPLPVLGSGSPNWAEADWSADEAELADWAGDRFEAAGLSLPSGIHLTFHSTTAPCEGKDGTFRPAEGHRVRVCRFHDEPQLERRLREHVLLHELAHLWVHETLSDAEREAFLTLRGAESWNAARIKWHQRGIEQAAEILTWGLLDRDPGFLAINDTTCEQLTAGYELLTGRAPINPDPGC